MTWIMESITSSNNMDICHSVLVFGFKTEEQIETALIPLMAEVFNNETLTVK